MSLTEKELDTLTELQLKRAGASRFAVNLDKLKKIRSEDRALSTKELVIMIAEHEDIKAEFLKKAKNAFKVTP